jgi:hypothetical protein
MTLALCAMNVKAKSISNGMEFPLKVEKTIGLNSYCNAIFKGDLQIVKSMISLGEDVNQKSLGMTPAIFAARYKRAEILELPIANGLKLKIKCDRGIGIKEYAKGSNAMGGVKSDQRKLEKVIFTSCQN